MKSNSKNILLVLMSVLIVCLIIFRPSKEINYHETEIKNLKQQNKMLFNSNDSLKSRNLILSQEIKDILITIDSTASKLADTEVKLNHLKNEKNKISDRVRVLNADDIARELSDYLNK